MNSLTITYSTEGPTDTRFLQNIIYRTFTQLAYECKGEIEVFEPIHVPKKIGGFVDQIIAIAKEVSWSDVLCVHVDSDSSNNLHVMENKIIPAFSAVENSDELEIAKNLVPVIPVQMTEAWLLADTALLINEIGSEKSAADLGLPVRYAQIEKISDPKRTIKEAIRIAFEGQPSRRRKPSISDLYLPISQRVPIETLRNLPSFGQFYRNARESLVNLNYM